MKGNSLVHATKSGLALAPQSVNNGTVNGPTISEPWKHGRQIVFTFLGGVWAATVDGIAKIQRLLRSDMSTWDDLPNAAGADLEFTQTLLDDTGDGESAIIRGTLDLTAIDATTYAAIRLVYIEGGSAAALVGALYEIFDLYTHPSGDTDDLWAKQRYTA